ncbi:hypothetical protein LSTR_LSTR016035 [Laodelphax striatellus]|uniref:Uncharacterized protein n=1 Tax=Laodelphax striatellus TaxID=195883 RepID=A0A482X867_LAOST|nr:hypothetical protein LSTR_LSTR016035 [Laodelphax striatellus]
MISFSQPEEVGTGLKELSDNFGGKNRENQFSLRSPPISGLCPVHPPSPLNNSSPLAAIHHYQSRYLL